MDVREKKESSQWLADWLRDTWGLAKKKKRVGCKLQASSKEAPSIGCKLQAALLASCLW